MKFEKVYRIGNIGGVVFGVFGLTSLLQAVYAPDWTAPSFWSTGYESMGWVTGKPSAGTRLCCFRFGLGYASSYTPAAQPAANWAGVW